MNICQYLVKNVGPNHVCYVVQSRRFFCFTCPFFTRHVVDIFQHFSLKVCQYLPNICQYLSMYGAYLLRIG